MVSLFVDRTIGSRTIAALVIVMVLLAPSFVDAFDTSRPATADLAPRADTGRWQELARYDGKVEVRPGLPFFIKMDPKTRDFRPLSLPDPDAGFSSLTKEAIADVPAWIRPNLTTKMAQISDVPLTTGEHASPAVGDLDQDGDMDLIVGDDLGVRFYINEGTADWPVFVSDPAILLSGDFFGDPAGGGFGMWAPAVGDLNGDGAADLLLGNGQGTLFFYENNEGTSPVTFKGPTPLDIDVGGNSHPALGDLDADGDLDLAVGNDRGTLSYYENTAASDSQTYLWTLRPLKFAGIETGRNSTPALSDLTGDDMLDLTVGSAAQGLAFYRNIGGTLVFEPAFYAGVTLSTDMVPMHVNLYPDRTTDLYVGQEDGRVLYYDNIGTVNGAQWRVWSSYDLFLGVSYYPANEYLRIRTQGTADRYARLIVNAEAKLRDEIGFSVANTAPEVLKALNDTQARLFVENAQLIYTIDSFLDYADITEKDDHTTVVYRTLVDGQVVKRELPRDVYYWYIVHPQLSDETAHYIDPTTGGPSDPTFGGKWWREYLFFHADDKYPPDPDPNDPNRRYPTTAPPLLMDLLDGIVVLWNGTKWNAPGDRDTYYGTNALIRVADWVGKTLALNEAESNDGERPIQPVRIASTHNGNCGELQDLTVAAARTALIPAIGVNMPGEDHVWIEFYDDGWHQWDNYWSDGGSIIANYMNYWEGWGDRGGAGIFAWRGDDATWEVTQKYVHLQDISKVTFTVRDRNGRPVDGARIVAASHWLLTSNTDPVEVTFPFPSTWNYTNYEGVSTLYLASQGDWAGANHNFSFKITSRLGHAEQPKTSLVQGQDYAFDFTLDGAVPDAELQMTTTPIDPNDASLRLGLKTVPGSGLQLPMNPADDRTQPVIISAPLATLEEANGTVLAFVVNGKNLDLYLKGLPFESYGAIGWGGAAPGSLRTVPIPTDEPSYIVIPTEGLVETTRNLELSSNAEALLKPPALKITGPKEGLSLPQGEHVNITGTVSDPYGITLLELSTDGGNYFRNIGSSLVNETYSYVYYTTGEALGPKNIRVMATNGLGVQALAQVNVTIEEIDSERPKVGITAPKNGEDFNDGDIIKVRGTASDNKGVEYLGLSLNNGGTWLDITDRLSSGQWVYDWDTRGRPADDYMVIAKAKDAYGNEATDRVAVTIIGQIIDEQEPQVGISRPVTGSVFELGTYIRIEGTATDNIGLEKLSLTFGSKTAKDITGKLSQGVWKYDWNTLNEEAGLYTITVTAQDGAGNLDSAVVQVKLVEQGGGGGGGGGDGQGGSVSDDIDPKIELYDPQPGLSISKGTVLLVYGKATDDSGTVYVELIIDGESFNITNKLQGGYFSYSLMIKEMETGTHTIIVRAYDRSGNKAEQSTTFIVKNKATPDKDIVTQLLNMGSGMCTIFVIIGIAAVAVIVSIVVRARSPPPPASKPLRKKIKTVKKAAR